MEENKENKKNNNGCLIIFVIAAIGELVYSISTISKESFAELGQFIILVASIAIIWGLIKLFGNNKSSTSENIVKQIDKSQEITKKSENKGCLKVILIFSALFVLFALIFNTIGNDFEFNFFIGVVIFVIIFIVLAACFWSNLNK